MTMEVKDTNGKEDCGWN